ncbi:mercuric reductase [Truepera radiovictrix]|uniref:FAD-dependent pyridine nucleotide-disulfide oxidoreductase n=1 Tax=Truepera radiovictrix (strain DSM 17093 / CIP 108686 / LMG 22925 / RQ-24) TaxID=649638 RepID=D7CXH9_TRURR|nr:mercuric reductase [Truepera radiovictrix]ADI14581.1 FAD-dependent pyridine nucleotide-disulfide oxidoreductase [Truepera radiovictrix DSM 17093]WMT56869.1 mercuric reductase [Truepera radiovictrix]
MADVDFDVIIIGAGQASVPLARALAEAGREVALAERKHLGGSCVNFGCTPTKAVISSAKVAHLARRAADYGVHVGAVEVDLEAVLARAESILQSSRQSLRSTLDEAGVRLIEGSARLAGRHGEAFGVQVGGETLRAGAVVLNTGTRTAIPPIEGLEALVEGGRVLTAETWLAQRTVPKHLAVLGGSYIGLELGQFYRRMGSEVTIFETAERIAAREDEDVSRALQALLEGEGVRFHLGAQVERVSAQSEGLELHLEGGERVAASHLLIAAGRQPNTDALDLSSVGLEPDDGGFLEVDERLASKVAGIWVAGDIRGGPMFTHTAYDDFEVLASQLLGEGERTAERLVPYAMFTDPQLGRVGMSEREAREAGFEVRVATYDMKANGRARALGEEDGFVKVVVDARTQKLLGAAVLAAEGAELVHVFVALMNAGAPYTVLDRALHIHPTLSEATKSVVKGLGA